MFYAITYTATTRRGPRTFRGDVQTITLSDMTRDAILATVEGWATEWPECDFSNVIVASHSHPHIVARNVHPTVRTVAGALADIDGMVRMEARA